LYKERTMRYFYSKQHSIVIFLNDMMCSANSVIMSVVEVFIHSVEYSKLCNSACVSPYDRASIVSKRLNQS